MSQTSSAFKSSHVQRVGRIASLVMLIMCAWTSVARADLVGHHEGARQLLLSGDGKIAFTSDTVEGQFGAPNQVRVWNISSRQLRAQLKARVNLVGVSRDGTRVCGIEGSDFDNGVPKTLSFWRVTDDMIRPTGKWVLPPRWKVLATRWEGARVRVAVSSGAIFRFDERAHCLGTAPLRWGKINRANNVAAFSPDGRRLVVDGYGESGNFCWYLFDAHSGKLQRKIADFEGWAFAVAFSEDGAILAALNQTYFDSASRGPDDIWDFRAVASGIGLPQKQGYYAYLNGNFPITFYGRALWCADNQMRQVQSGLLAKFQLPKAWRQKQLRALRFARDGKTMVALDDNGDIWSKQIGTP